MRICFKDHSSVKDFFLKNRILCVHGSVLSIIGTCWKSWDKMNFIIINVFLTGKYHFWELLTACFLTFNGVDDDDELFFRNDWPTKGVCIFMASSSRDHCRRFLPSQISNTPRAGFELAQNLSSDFVEWSCAAVITTTPKRYEARCTS